MHRDTFLSCKTEQKSLILKFLFHRGNFSEKEDNLATSGHGETSVGRLSHIDLVQLLVVNNHLLIGPLSLKHKQTQNTKPRRKVRKLFSSSSHSRSDLFCFLFVCFYLFLLLLLVRWVLPPWAQSLHQRGCWRGRRSWARRVASACADRWP
jgi:hypothetical protein